MKNSFYYIAEFLIILWFLLFFGFETKDGIHLLLFLAVFMIIIRIGFDNKYSISKIRKYKYFRFDAIKKFLT